MATTEADTLELAAQSKQIVLYLSKKAPEDVRWRGTGPAKKFFSALHAYQLCRCSQMTAKRRKADVGLGRHSGPLMTHSGHRREGLALRPLRTTACEDLSIR